MGVMSVFIHEEAMDIVMKKERERTKWRSGSRMEIPKDRCRTDSKGGVWGGNYSAVVVFSLYRCSRFTLMGD